MYGKNNIVMGVNYYDEASFSSFELKHRPISIIISV